jgi:hypothetical protein
MFLFAIIFCLLLFAAFVLVVADSIRGKGRFGINFKTPVCPTCGNKMPAVRTPKSINQALWGGATCTVCGTEVDKWGKTVKTADETKSARPELEKGETDYVHPFDESGKTRVEKIFEEK